MAKRKLFREKKSGEFTNEAAEKATPDDVTAETIKTLTVYHIFKDESGEHRKEAKIKGKRVLLYGDEIAIEIV